MTHAEFGLLLPHFNVEVTGPQLSRWARTAEDLGFDSLWVRDHVFISPGHRHHGGIDETGFVTESLLTIATLVGVTSTIRFGTAVLTPHRQPVKVAQLLGTLAHLSGGRIICGIGGGSDPQEFAALGVSFEDRIDLVRDTIEACRRGWRGEGADGVDAYTSEVFRIEPAPPGSSLPFWYGGITDNSARRAVELADGWLPSRLPFDRLERKLGLLRALLADSPKRDDFTVAALPQVGVARSRHEALTRFNLDGVLREAMASKAIRGDRTSLEIEDLEGQIIWGAPSDICRSVERFHALGVHHLVFDLRGSFADFDHAVRTLGEHVLPRFR